MYISTERLPTEQFEEFANKIVSIQYAKKIYSFSQGPDGGIDGMDDSKSPSIIVQSKRYQLRTSSSTLRDVVLSEIKKVKQLASQNGWNQFQYVVVTSGTLTPAAKKMIRDAAGTMMSSDANILTELELSELAIEDKYDKVFREYQLIPGNMLVQLRNQKLESLDIETSGTFSDFDVAYIAQTQALELAYRTLIEKRLVLVTGNAGVGKSTTCQLLAMMFNSRKDGSFSIISRGIDNVQSVVDLYAENFRDKANNLVVLFDDFLGRNTVEATDTQISSILKLMAISHAYENLYVILNSRSQILKDAGIRNMLLENYTSKLESGDQNVIIDLDKLSDVEKAKILRFNIQRVFDQLDDENRSTLSQMYDDLRVSKRYRDIIHHRNFNPRLIEQVSHEWQLVGKSQSYFKFIIRALNTPQKIYDELFDQLNDDEKYYLVLLFSFGDIRHDPVRREVLKNAFDALSLNLTVDSRQTVDRLLGSWIKLYVKGKDNDMFIDFLNPSITDYLKVKIQGLETMKNFVLNHAVTFTQLEYNSTDVFHEKIANKFGQLIDSENFVIDRLIYILSQEPNKKLISEFKRLIIDHIDSQGVVITDSSYLLQWNRFIDRLDYLVCPQYINHLFEILLHSSRGMDLIESIFESVYDADEFNEIIERLNELATDALGVNFEDIPHFSTVPALSSKRLQSYLKNTLIEFLQTQLDDEISEDLDVRSVYPGPDSEADSLYTEEVLSNARTQAYEMLVKNLHGNKFEEEIQESSFDYDILSQSVEKQINWLYGDDYDDDAYDRWRDDQSELGESLETADDILNRPL